MWTAFDRAIVAVGDLPAARDTYARLLGRRPSFDGADVAGGTHSVVFRLSNGALELRAPLGPGAAPALEAHLVERGPGVLGIGLATDDAERAAAWLAGRPGLSLAALTRRVWDSECASGSGGRWVRREIALDPAATRGIPIVAAEDVQPEDGAPPAALACAEASAISGLDHVVVRTRDPDASIALYRDTLGLRVALDRRFEQRGVRLVFMRVAGVTIELAARLDAERLSSAPDVPGGIAYQVLDPSEARERVAAAGFDVSPVRPGHNPGTAVCTVRSETCGVPTLLIGPDRA
jgi:catechol 2,3-dioxygenase-like lactoylglutathione lyase family enzyme